jgi:GT2 family glycosyltransferase
MTVRISVIVPTYRRPDLLGRCLAALLEQDLDPWDYEIVVADDAISHVTRREVERAAERTRLVALAAGGSASWVEEPAAPRVRYLPVVGAHGPAAARNAGWRAADGEIIAFTDDDCLPDPGWLRAGLAAMAPGVAAACGRVVVPLPPDPTDYERDVAGLEVGEFVTANCFVRRSALAAVGGFDERFSAAWREDSDLQFALLSRGERVARAEAAVVTHPARPAGWGVSLRQQRKSLFNALLYKKHPALYRARIQPAPPWHYYAAVGALAGLFGLPRWRWLFGGLWALLTGRFAAQRLRGTSRAPAHVAEMIVTSAAIPPLAVFWRLRGAAKFRVWFL